MTTYIPPPHLAHLTHLAAQPERPRLLVVDDQPINIQTLYQIFHIDHEVFMATSGEQALEFCRNTPPDLILLDVVMPGMDGLEVCRQLKADSATADIPVIFVT
ncbi:MAG: response regulator, partial [Betaproteobacteria bacterium]|nr:response regulator [Betaproteobacteria bacterium]